MTFVLHQPRSKEWHSGHLLSSRSGRTVTNHLVKFLWESCFLYCIFTFNLLIVGYISRLETAIVALLNFGISFIYSPFLVFISNISLIFGVEWGFRVWTLMSFQQWWTFSYLKLVEIWSLNPWHWSPNAQILYTYSGRCKSLKTAKWTYSEVGNNISIGMRVQNPRMIIIVTWNSCMLLILF